MGAGIISSLKQRNLDFQIIGICGPQMIAQGAQSLYPMESINIIGLEGVATNLARIIRLRKKLIDEFLRVNLDVFIGIDAPDFNLKVERILRRAGVPALHYVSPTIWAWRSYRVGKIKQSVSKMLTIYPFEGKLYEQYNIPYQYVGHPLADLIAKKDFSKCRKNLGFNSSDVVVAILPGSRLNEVKRLSPVFLEVATRLASLRLGIKFVTPLASEVISREFHGIIRDQGQKIKIQTVEKHAQEAIAASDVVLTASGTAALEAALIGKPVVVAYIVSKFTYLMVQILGHVKHYSILNHLCETAMVPEFIQKEANMENLADSVMQYLDNQELRNSLTHQFAKIAQQLCCNANDRVADEIVKIARHGK